MAERARGREAGSYARCPACRNVARQQGTTPAGESEFVCGSCGNRWAGGEELAIGGIDLDNRNPMARVKSAYLFRNGMVAAFNYDGHQIPEFQGPLEEVFGRLAKAADHQTEWHGFNGNPLSWRQGEADDGR